MDIVSDSWSAERDRLGLCSLTAFSPKPSPVSSICHEKVYGTFELLGKVAYGNL